MSAQPRDSRAAGPSDRLAPLAVTMGDPAGIGPDITLAAWLERARLRLPPFMVFGDGDVLRQRAEALGLTVPLAPVASGAEAGAAFAAALPVRAGPAGTTGDSVVAAAVEAATTAVVTGEALALVTNPATKRSLQGPSLKYPGHTEFLAMLAARHHPGRTFRPVMMLVSDELKVVPVTVHIPLAAVAGSLTRELLLETVEITAAALRGDFGIANPRLAVCGLNPHAGEDGLIGSEEADVIAPAIAELAGRGMAVSGPLSADTLFHAEARQGYDAAIAMYHDQALIPIKTLAFDRGVNATLGLPFVRTSPDHGTAFALAGTGRARAGSFIAALRLAAELGQRRAEALARTHP
jgi:4-hydroxythreonine-4-phosphate dehydrogenase